MDEFNLNDALAGQTNAAGQQNPSQGQNWNNPWGGPGQPYPGYAPPGPGQQYPGAPPGGQQYPASGPGQQYPGAAPGGQPYPGGYPAPGQQYPGGFPGYPGFPAPGQQYPGAPVPGQPTAPSAPMPTAPTGPLKLPHVLSLPSGVMPGMVLTFNGVASPNCKRWCIDLKKGNDIVFHCNPRFDENPNVIVRNSLFRDKWGSEERTAPKFPFQKGQQFTMQIICEQEGYRVVCNNENLCQFRHRDRDFQQIKAAHINGDITLNGATITMM